MSKIYRKSCKRSRSQSRKRNIVTQRQNNDVSESKDPSADRITQLQRTVGNQAVQRLIKMGKVQAKLRIGLPNDKYEQEADMVADRVMNMSVSSSGQVNGGLPMENSGGGESVQRQAEDEELQRQPHEDEEVQTKPIYDVITPLAQRQEEDDELRREPQEEEESIQAKQASGSAPKVTPNIENSINSIRGGGKPLPKSARAFFEPRFGQDFSNVRVHTDDNAAQTSKSLNAKAVTTGNNIMFGAGQYAPEIAQGKRLLGHELTHVVQQGHTLPVIQRSGNNKGKYTPQERKAMAEGKITGTKKDKEMGKQHGFQPGDIVFRLGSRELAKKIKNPVTHGGIYIGDGLIHDVVGFGNRHVRAELFFKEADDPSVVKIIRFKGPHRNLIISRLVQNIKKRNFKLPSDTMPWNLFSSADNYNTATCLEYSHAQFLHAIKELSIDQNIPIETRKGIIKTYFTTGQNIPRNIIKLQTLKVEGKMGYALNETRLLIAAADYLAEDVDAVVFKNRWEGKEELKNVGSNFVPIFWQTMKLNAFTYKSFADSRNYFHVVK